MLSAIEVPCNEIHLTKYDDFTEFEFNTDLEKGQIRQSEFPSYVIQAHIPYIAPGDLVNVYPLFEIRLPQSHWL